MILCSCHVIPVIDIMGSNTSPKEKSGSKALTLSAIKLKSNGKIIKTHKTIHYRLLDTLHEGEVDDLGHKEIPGWDIIKGMDYLKTVLPS